MARKAVADRSDVREVVFCFDTTGSMYPCIAQVKRKVERMVRHLMQEVPGIRIGCMWHGDYIDMPNMFGKLELTTDIEKICAFIRNAPQTDGGDTAECYERMLHEGLGFRWTPGARRVFVLIGDDVPHEPSYPQNKQRLNWRDELDRYTEAGTQVYGVQCLGRHHADPFYMEIARRTGGVRIQLSQFHLVEDLIFAICMKQIGDDRVAIFEQDLIREGRMSRAAETIFDGLLGRTARKSRWGEAGLEAVDPARFQVLSVDSDQAIREFVQNNGLRFKTGRGFYEWTKRETVQEKKEVVLVDRNTGDMFTGGHARELIGLPYGNRADINPNDLPAELRNRFKFFIQSTSYNRKLKAGTQFLYEVEDWDRADAA